MSATMTPARALAAASMAIAIDVSTAVAQFNIGKGVVKELYLQNCASCHGPNFEGSGQGVPLFGRKWVYGATDNALAATIADGIPNSVMAPWKNVLSPDQIRSLVILIREAENEHLNSPANDTARDVEGVVFEAGSERFRLEEVLLGESESSEPDSTIWGFAFVDDATILATQRDGVLWRVCNDCGSTKLRISGTPAVWRPGGESGLFDIALDPEFDTNGWIYLSYSEAQGGNRGSSEDAGMTVVARGRIVDDRWTDHQVIFRAAERFYTGAKHHFGSRLLFRDGYLFFSIGDRVIPESSQDPASPLGKIHRIRPDGSIPEGNPFAKDPNACPSVWTLGNRNVQGLAVRPSNGAIWSSEHGPRGGDELNIIEPSANYGWPLLTHGINYDGTPISSHTSLPGMVDPIHQWTPSIASAGISFYTGLRFPSWHGHLLVGGMWSEELHLVRLDGNQVIDDRIVLSGLGRVRHVVDGPDGFPYISLTRGEPRKGSIFRLVPVP